MERKSTGVGQFGAWLSEMREQHGLTLSAIADRAGVTTAALSALETGRVKQPRPLNKQRIEEAVAYLAAGGVSPFGQWLRQEREAKGLSVPQLAELVGVSPPSIYNIESGKTQNANKATRQKIERVLGATPSRQIIEETERKTDVPGLGSLQSFDPHAFDLLPAEAGVYVLYDISDRPVYVGRSANIARRLKQHANAFWYKKPIVQDGAYIPIADKVLRNQTEEILIKFLRSNAIVNKVYVDRDLEQE